MMKAIKGLRKSCSMQCFGKSKRSKHLRTVKVQASNSNFVLLFDYQGKIDSAMKAIVI
jgi:hypothetical protein